MIGCSEATLGVESLSLSGVIACNDISSIRVLCLLHDHDGLPTAIYYAVPLVILLVSAKRFLNVSMAMRLRRDSILERITTQICLGSYGIQLLELLCKGHFPICALLPLLSSLFATRNLIFFPPVWCGNAQKLYIASYVRNGSEEHRLVSCLEDDANYDDSLKCFLASHAVVQRWVIRIRIRPVTVCL